MIGRAFGGSLRPCAAGAAERIHSSSRDHSGVWTAALD